MTTRELAELARRHGFHRAAAVPVTPSSRIEAFSAWLAAGHHGEMAYLASPEHTAPRADVRGLVAAARTVVVVALAYQRDDPPAPPGLVALRGRIARYARGDDYHLVLRDRLVALADELARALGRPIAARPCVDAAPVLEREWAERGGLGFVAKNTMIIAPGLGSYVLLGELVLDVDLVDAPPPAPLASRCGSCRACLDACPTGAFVDAYLLDARSCISYLTIEHRGVIPRGLRARMGTWIFGCDVCQQVCPFNAGAGEPAPPPLPPRDLAHARPDLVELAGLGTNQLRRYVRRTALRRAPGRSSAATSRWRSATPATPARRRRSSRCSPTRRRWCDFTRRGRCATWRRPWARPSTPSCTPRWPRASRSSPTTACARSCVASRSTAADAVAGASDRRRTRACGRGPRDRRRLAPRIPTDHRRASGPRLAKGRWMRPFALILALALAGTAACVDGSPPSLTLTSDVLTPPGGKADGAAAGLVECRSLPDRAVPAAGFDHARSAIAALADPHHHAQDVIVAPAETATLTAAFRYGTVRKDLEDERVDAHVDLCDAWVALGTAITDDDGVARWDAIVELPPGAYRVRFEVRGDGTTTESTLWVLPIGTHLTVSDLDGTLTTGDDELVWQLLDEDHVPEAYPAAAELTRAHAARGDVVVYLSGRPAALLDLTRPQLADGGFAPGPLILTDRARDSLPTSTGVGAFKAGRLLELRARGYLIDVAYGNATTDIEAYAAASVAPGDTWIVGRHGGEGGTRSVDDGWAARAAEVAALPPSDQPF
ncbi:MAG: tRNA epoxyqueuosine(34) reductase QueG [Kofleriaceae bacterium]